MVVRWRLCFYSDRLREHKDLIKLSKGAGCWVVVGGMRAKANTGLAFSQELSDLFFRADWVCDGMTDWWER